MIFVLGREYAIPLPTICVGHMKVNCRTKYADNSWIGEVLLLNEWCVPKQGANDNEVTTKL